MSGADSTNTQVPNDINDWQDIDDKSTGIKKKLLKEGRRRSPENATEVVVNCILFESWIYWTYVARLQDNTVVEEEKNLHTVLGKEEVISGLEMAICGMKLGETSLFRIPAAFAFGEEGKPPMIPSNATLDFEVLLIDCLPEMDLTKDGGIIKKIIKSGVEEETPKEDVLVKVNYIASLTDGHEFANKKGVELMTGEGRDDSEFPPHVLKAIQTMSIGERAKYTVAPEYAYGEEGNENKGILGFETLVYDIELLEFEKEHEFHLMDTSQRFEVAARKKQQGNELFNMGQYERAKNKYRVMLSLMKDTTGVTEQQQQQARKVMLSANLNIAASALCCNNYSECIACCDQALELDPQNIKALFRRGKAYVGTRQWEEASKDFRKALELDPNNKDVQKELSKIKVKRPELLNQTLIDEVLRKLKQYAENSDPTQGNLIQRFFTTMTTPGITKEHIQFINYVFGGLFFTLMVVILSQGPSATSAHIYVLLVLSLGLFGSLHWYVPHIMRGNIARFVTSYKDFEKKSN